MTERWVEFHLKGEATGIDIEAPIEMALLMTNEKQPLSSWPPPDQQTATPCLRQAEPPRVDAPTGAQPTPS